MLCVLVCHPHLTIILRCTAVWVRACGFGSQNNKFCHFRGIFGSFGVRNCFYLVVCLLVGAALRYCYFLVHIIQIFATVITPVLGVLVNTLLYHDTVNFVQDSETEDPQADHYH